MDLPAATALTHKLCLEADRLMHFLIFYHLADPGFFDELLLPFKDPKQTVNAFVRS